MNSAKRSDIADDAEKLLRFITQNGIDPSIPAPPATTHMGAIIADVVLQRRQHWNSTVKPRLDALVEKQSEAATTAGLLELIIKGNLSEAISWNGEDRLKEINDIASTLNRLGINTPQQLALALTAEPSRNEVRSNLAKIKNVGPKSLDYLDILVGIPATAIDSRLQALAEMACITDTSYGHLQSVIIRLADYKHWDLRNLDHALWTANLNLK